VTELRVEIADTFDALRPDWTLLAEGTGNVFSTVEWAETWWRHFARGKPISIVTGRSRDGEVAAVLPLYVARRRPLGMLRFLGHGPADELGPVYAPSGRVDVARLLPLALRELRCQLLLAEQLPGRAAWPPLLGATPIRHEASPVLRGRTGGWDEFLSTRSANFREQMRRRERGLGDAHAVSLRLTDDPSRLAEDMTTLFRLHRAIRPQSDFGPEPFHRDFAGVALERGWLRLWTLELDGKAAAAWYGFRFHGIESYYQAGRDPDFDRLSVGFVLLVHTLREALNDGVSEYRFGRGEESYKYRFADSDPGVDTVLLARGAVGAAGVAGVAAARRALSLRRRRH
jgi:CelD/BcsL family acetyltransferase involved in cellulose biosynthesis